MATESKIKRFLAEHANPIVVAIGLIGMVLVTMQGDRQTRFHLDGVRAEMATTAGRLDARIDEMGARLDARIDEMGARLDARIDRVDARIDETNRRIDGVQNTLVEISGKLDRLISAIEVRNERSDARIAALEKAAEAAAPETAPAQTPE